MTDAEVQQKVIEKLKSGSWHKYELMGYLEDAKPSVIMRNVAALVRNGAVARDGDMYSLPADAPKPPA